MTACRLARHAREVDLRAVLDAHGERGALLAAAFDAASPRDRRRVTLGEWFCPSQKSCLLLTVWQASGLRLARLAPYKLSPTLNAQTSIPSARAKNTSDGDRHWRGSVVLVDELWPEAGVPLNCDHYRGVLPAADLWTALEGVTPRRPVRRVVGR